MKHFKKKHLEKREKAEKRKALKKERRESVKKQKEIQEAAIKSSFKKPNQINKYIINSLFTMKPEDHDPITKNYFYYL